MEQLKSARFFIESVPGHSVIAVHQNALRTQALGNEGGGGLEAGQEVGVGHVRNGDLENRLQPLKKSFFNIFEKNRFITFLEKNVSITFLEKNFFITFEKNVLITFLANAFISFLNTLTLHI
jgi:hypothetical protein